MPRRRPLGQHFLHDRAAIDRIVAAIATNLQAPVVEIGPGRGALTGPLIEAFGRIAAVEVDPRLAAELRCRYEASRLLLIEGDALRLRFDEIARALGAAGQIAVVGNLPYGISKPFADKLVRERHSVERAVLMFQREVADRLTSSPGRRSYCPLTVLAGGAFEIRALFDLSPRAFHPQPRVDSRVTVWRPRAHRAWNGADEHCLRACLAASFGQRRRTLRNNLRSALGSETAADALLAATAIDGGLRAERLEPSAFARLAGAWPRSLI